jgi:hypothetical protein
MVAVTARQKIAKAGYVLPRVLPVAEISFDAHARQGAGCCANGKEAPRTAEQG